MAEQQEQTKKKSKFHDFINNRNHWVFLAFVVLSFFIWFLNYLNKNLTSDIVVKYKFKNIPKAISNEGVNDGEFKITASGQGYNLLQESLKSRSIPLNINLTPENSTEKSLLHYATNKGIAYIVTDELKPIIKKKLGEKINLIDINPDTIFFDMINIVEKKVPIDISNVKFNLITGEKITTTNIYPDSVLIIGQKASIDTIEKIYVEKSKIKHIKSKEKYNFDLDIPHGITSTTNNINVTFDIEMYTETTKQIKINAINFPAEYELTLLPQEVNISYNVPLSYYDKVSENDFTATIDYKKAVRNYIDIEVVSQNPNINIIRKSPETCSFILNKK